MQKYIILFLLCCIVFSNSYAQDIIHKKDERIIAAKVLKIDSTSIFYKEITDLKGPTLEILKSDVDHINFDYESKTVRRMGSLNYRRPKNAVSLSLGGSSGMIGLKYDRVLLESSDFFLSGGLGVGSIVSQTNINTHLSGNWNFGRGKHNFELGIGFAVALNELNNQNMGFHKYYLTAPLIGYRLQPFESFFLRAYLAGFAMLNDPWGDSFVIPTIGVDLGFSF